MDDEDEEIIVERFTVTKTRGYIGFILSNRKRCIVGFIGELRAVVYHQNFTIIVERVSLDSAVIVPERSQSMIS